MFSMIADRRREREMIADKGVCITYLSWIWAEATAARARAAAMNFIVKEWVFKVEGWVEVKVGDEEWDEKRRRRRKEKKKETKEKEMKKKGWGRREASLLFPQVQAPVSTEGRGKRSEGGRNSKANRQGFFVLIEWLNGSEMNRMNRGGAIGRQPIARTTANNNNRNKNNTKQTIQRNRFSPLPHSYCPLSFSRCCSPNKHTPTRFNWVGRERFLLLSRLLTFFLW